MNKYAPILIPTLNRYLHFERCVNTLSLSDLAIETDLYIALDYPLKDSHWEGYLKIKDYISKIEGFKNVYVIERAKNFGAEKNLTSAINFLFENHNYIVLTEDDNEFSECFLDYMNKGNIQFKNRKDVFSICGYNYPIVMPTDLDSNVYFWRGFSAWGCGIWKEKWSEIDFTGGDVNRFLMNPSNIFKLNKYAGNYFPALLEVELKNHVTGDTLVSMYLVKNNYGCIFPNVSMVRNHGHDGTGVHGGLLVDNIYSSQQIDANKEFNFKFENVNLIENVNINLLLKKHFRLNFLRLAYTYLKYFSYFISNKLKVYGK